MFIQCYKTEFVKKAIEVNTYNTDQFIWIDFGIFHTINNDALFIHLMNNLTNEYDCVRIAGGYYLEHFDVYRQISWCFLGSIFGGPANKLLEFATLMKEKCITTIQNEKTIIWEINLWYLIYKEYPELFSRYIANHNPSMIAWY